eukprot:NODE_820_length_3933_cov_0.227960.p1 type:complete len:719 gc:universal NODE_820_length_3933_cov_0.227960:2648-492(-)
MLFALLIFGIDTGLPVVTDSQSELQVSEKDFPLMQLSDDYALFVGSKDFKFNKCRYNLRTGQSTDKVLQLMGVLTDRRMAVQEQQIDVLLCSRTKGELPVDPIKVLRLYEASAVQCDVSRSKVEDFDGQSFSLTETGTYWFIKSKYLNIQVKVDMFFGIPVIKAVAIGYINEIFLSTIESPSFVCITDKCSLSIKESEGSNWIINSPDHVQIQIKLTEYYDFSVYAPSSYWVLNPEFLCKAGPSQVDKRDYLRVEGYSLFDSEYKFPTFLSGQNGHFTCFLPHDCSDAFTDKPNNTTLVDIDSPKSLTSESSYSKTESLSEETDINASETSQLFHKSTYAAYPTQDQVYTMPRSSEYPIETNYSGNDETLYPTRTQEIQDYKTQDLSSSSIHTLVQTALSEYTSKETDYCSVDVLEYSNYCATAKATVEAQSSIEPQDHKSTKSQATAEYTSNEELDQIYYNSRSTESTTPHLIPNSLPTASDSAKTSLPAHTETESYDIYSDNNSALNNHEDYYEGYMEIGNLMPLSLPKKYSPPSSTHRNLSSHESSDILCKSVVPVSLLQELKLDYSFILKDCISDHNLTKSSSIIDSTSFKIKNMIYRRYNDPFYPTSKNQYTKISSFYLSSTDCKGTYTNTGCICPRGSAGNNCEIKYQTSPVLVQPFSTFFKHASTPNITLLPGHPSEPTLDTFSNSYFDDSFFSSSSSFDSLLFIFTVLLQ